MRARNGRRGVGISAENHGRLLLCSASEKEGLPCGVAVSGKERANGRAGLQARGADWVHGQRGTVE